MKVLIINQAETIELLPFNECIGVMEDGFTMLSRGGAVMLPRTPLKISGNKILGTMPSYLPDLQKAGLKATTVFSGNSGTKYHVHQGVVLLFETENGTLQAIVDAAEITTIRTGATSALATKLLAKPEAGNLAILGAGTQGSCHLEAMLLVRPVYRVRVYDSSLERAQKFAERESKKHGLNVEAVQDVENTVKEADLICTATPAAEPILKGEWIAPGAHINSVGFGGAAARELDTALLQKSIIFVDYMDTVLYDCGDLLVPIRQGEIDKNQISGCLGDLLTGAVRGRESEEEITLFKSVGVAIQDLAAVNYIYKKALEKGMGSFIDLGGHNQLEES